MNTNVHFNVLTRKIVDHFGAEFSDTTVVRGTLLTFKSADKGKFCRCKPEILVFENMITTKYDTGMHLLKFSSVGHAKCQFARDSKGTGY